MADDWITIELLDAQIREAEDHPSRIKYLENYRKGMLWYRKEADIIPNAEFDDVVIPKENVATRDNLIKEGVDELTSIFMKNDPIVRRYPYYPDDADLADDIDAVAHAAWVKANLSGKMSSALFEAALCGLSVVKVFWDAKRKMVYMVKPAPGDLYIDPYASNDNRLMDCRYIVHKTRQRVDVVLRRYKDEAEIALGLRHPSGRKKSALAYKFKQTMKKFANMTKAEINEEVKEMGDGDDDRVDPFIDVYEHWIFPVTPHDMEGVIGDTDLDSAGYPIGVVVTRIKDHIVKIRANPFQKTESRQVENAYGMMVAEKVKVGAQRHPFAPLWWDRLADQQGNNYIYECMGMVEPMIPMQFNIDGLRRNIYIHARTTANPWGLYNKNALDIPPDAITMGPGDFYPLKDAIGAVGDAIYVHSGAQMSPDVWAFLQSDMDNIKPRAGLKPGVVGGYPQMGTSHTPAMTIGALQEAAFGPLWKRVKELTDCLLDVSILLDGHIQQFYTPGQFLEVSRDGIERHIEFTSRHVVANFRREVVSGTTTPLHDLERDQKLSMITAVCNEALMSASPDLIESTILYLKNLRYPWTYDWIELLNRKLFEIQQQQQQLAQLGAAGMMEQQQGIEPPAEEAMASEGEPAEYNEQEMAGLEQLSRLAGRMPEEIEIALEE